MGAPDGRLDPVFATTAGTMQGQTNAYRWFKEAAREAGVGWAAWHTLRHTCASLDFTHGMSAKQVQIKLGHHSAAFTLSVYVHLLPKDLADAGYLDDVLPIPTTTPIPTPLRVAS